MEEEKYCKDTTLHGYTIMVGADKPSTPTGEEIQLPEELTTALQDLGQWSSPYQLKLIYTTN